MEVAETLRFRYLWSKSRQTMQNLRAMDRINLTRKRYNFAKSNVREEQGLYVANVPSTQAQLPLDSIICGDALQVLRSFPDGVVDLVITSPPYADKRKNSYGGIHPDRYVQWFIPIACELKRILKPSGTFILNIKEGVSEGERETYVLELIFEMRMQGW